MVGKIVKEALHPALERLNRVNGLTVFLYGLPSPYWGQEQVVTGLLTGQDLVSGLKGKNLGDKLLLPSVMLKEGEEIFLDDMTVNELSNLLNIPIHIVHGANNIVAAALGDL